jgi:putative ABC transport system permease protein
MLPLRYSARNLVARPAASALTAAGVGLAAFLLVVLSSMAQGIRHALVTTGDARNALVLHKGAPMEWSDIEPPILDIVRYAADVKCAAPEYVNTIWLPRGDRQALFRLRGVNGDFACVHDNVHALQGEVPTSGDKIAVGKGLATRLGIAVGDQVHFGRRTWTVAGIFAAGGTSFESEAWVPLAELMADFKHEKYSVISLRLASPGAAERLPRKVENDKRLAEYEAQTEVKYYSKQVEFQGPLQGLALVVSIIMAIGAVFGSMTTLYTAVAQRAREIGTLRVLGFARRTILASFLVESLLLALAGGAVGSGLGLLGHLLSGSFWGTTFKFRVTPSVFASGLILAALTGFFGGLLPAWRAARLPVTRALRD